MNHLVAAIVREQQELGVPEVFARDVKLGDILQPARGNLVQVVVGVRRCGKTYRLYQEMGRVLSQTQCPQSHLLYFNFEDERLRPYAPTLINDVVESFYELHPEAREEGAYLFFDEIQEVPDWGVALRRIIDTQKVTIYVSGSSSKMLSTEVASEFRGRSLSREMFPMSFSEFTRFHGMDTATLPQTENGIIATAAEEAQLKQLCSQYLERGGFISVQGLEQPDVVALLQNYANRTVNSDVVERYNVRNPVVAARFVSRCLAGSGRELSVNKVRGEFAGRGLRTSREMLSLLLEYYEDAYLLFRVPEFSRALASNPRASAKVYAVDPGMFLAFSKAAAQEAGQRLENAVFLKLRRSQRLVRDGSVARLLLEEKSQRYEVDFIVGDALTQEAYQLVQVCWSLEHEATKHREVRALQAAMSQYGLAEATIVTFDQSEVIDVPEGRIRVVPAWRWLLD